MEIISALFTKMNFLGIGLAAFVAVITLILTWLSGSKTAQNSKLEEELDDIRNDRKIDSYVDSMSRSELVDKLRQFERKE